MSDEDTRGATGLAAQWGLITRRQALDSGHSPQQVRTRAGPRGPWVSVRRGVYAVRERWDAAGDSERALMADVAAHLSMRLPHALSHDSAARAMDLPLLRPMRPLIHITRQGVLGTRTEWGVKHHLGRESPAQINDLDGVLVTGLARTSLDLAREHGFPAGVVAIDAARRRGATQREYEHELARMKHWPFVTVARRALHFSDPGAESPAESLGRILVDELGLGEVQSQFAVRLGDRTVWCDLRVGCHVFEVDGRVKYRRVEEGGLAEDPSEVIWAEKLRERDICSVGLGMSRIVWSDFWGEQRDLAIARLRREYALTRQRFGDRLPEHLERFARSHPRPVR